MTELFLTLLNMSIAAGWLIIAAVLLRPLLKRSPRAIKCVIWALVGIRLVCPLTLESALSLIPSAETISPDILYSTEPEIHSGISALNSAVNPAVSEVLAPDAAASATPAQVIAFAASVVWLAGMAALLVYAAVSSLRLHRRVKTAVRLRENLYQSENISSPFILGAFRPRVYIPFGLDGRELDCVIAHETAHIRRRDHLWKPLGFLLLTVYWFNPLIWLAYCLLCRDIELACDERVIKNFTAEEKKTYSATLLAFSTPRRMISACPLAFGEIGAGERIKSVLNYKKPALWIILAAGTAVAVLAVCFLTNPKTEPSAEDLTPFGYSYRVTEILYDAPVFSFTYTPQTAPQYRLDESGTLFTSGEITSEEQSLEWRTVGTATETVLDEASFDDCFISADGVSGWRNELTPADLRKDNLASWQIIPRNDGELYCLLMQSDGTLYLACGHRYEDNHDMFRWLFRLEPSDGEAPPEVTSSPIAAVETADVPAVSNAPAALPEGKTLVSVACLYMNPLSSFAPIGGDSGCTYLIEADSFTIKNRAADSSATVTPVKWSWEPFPFSDDEWNELFSPLDGGSLLDGYSEILYQPISEDRFILSTDGELQLVETYSNRNLGRYVWSIYTLVPQERFGSARWNFNPLLSSGYPAFHFDVDLPFDSVTVFTATGELVDGEDRNVRSDSFDIPTGKNGFYWSPFLENGGTLMSAEIQLFASDGSCAATVYISGEPSADDEYVTVYSASLVGKGLKLEQSENGGIIKQQ